VHMYIHTHTSARARIYIKYKIPFVDVTNEQFNSQKRIMDPSEKMRLKVGGPNTTETAIEVTRRSEGGFFNGWFMNRNIKKRRFV
jgi:hypothetical protein